MTPLRAARGLQAVQPRISTTRKPSQQSCPGASRSRQRIKAAAPFTPVSNRKAPTSPRKMLRGQTADPTAAQTHLPPHLHNHRNHQVPNSAGSPRPVNRPTTSSPPPLMHPTPTAQAPLPLVGRMPWRFERPALLQTHLPRLHLMGLSRHGLPPAIQGWMVSKHQTPMAPLPQTPGGNPHL